MISLETPDCPERDPLLDILNEVESPSVSLIVCMSEISCCLLIWFKIKVRDKWENNGFNLSENEGIF